MNDWKSAEECYERVSAWRKAHPHATWREIFDNVPNHYAHPVSLYGSMRQVEERRAREDFEFEQKHPIGTMTRWLPRCYSLVRFVRQL